MYADPWDQSSFWTSYVVQANTRGFEHFPLLIREGASCPVFLPMVFNRMSSAYLATCGWGQGTGSPQPRHLPRYVEPHDVLVTHNAGITEGICLKLLVKGPPNLSNILCTMAMAYLVFEAMPAKTTTWAGLCIILNLHNFTF